MGWCHHDTCTLMRTVGALQCQGLPPRHIERGECYVMHTRCDWRHHTVHVVTANQIVAATKAKDHFSSVYTFKAWGWMLVRLVWARSRITHFRGFRFFPQRTSERTAHRNENLVTDTRDDIKQSYIVTSSPLTKQRKCLISWHFGKVS